MSHTVKYNGRDIPAAELLHCLYHNTTPVRTNYRKRRRNTDDFSMERARRIVRTRYDNGWGFNFDMVADRPIKTVSDEHLNTIRPRSVESYDRYAGEGMFEHCIEQALKMKETI